MSPLKPSFFQLIVSSHCAFSIIQRTTQQTWGHVRVQHSNTAHITHTVSLTVWQNGISYGILCSFSHYINLKWFKWVSTAPFYLLWINQNKFEYRCHLCCCVLFCCVSVEENHKSRLLPCHVIWLLILLPESSRSFLVCGEKRHWTVTDAFWFYWSRFTSIIQERRRRRRRKRGRAEGVWHKEIDPKPPNAKTQPLIGVLPKKK